MAKKHVFCIGVESTKCCYKSCYTENENLQIAFPEISDRFGFQFHIREQTSMSFVFGALGTNAQIELGRVFVLVYSDQMPVFSILLIIVAEDFGV